MIDHLHEADTFQQLGTLADSCRVAAVVASGFAFHTASHQPTTLELRMDATEQAPQARLLTPAELGLCVRLFREMRQRSQEQLAEIYGLNVRTIQRIEQGQAASLDTRRALARAFEFEDVDVLNKPFTIPTEEELKVQKQTFDREHVMLTALPLTTGKQLAKLA